jgi:hypothetical protein
MPRANFPIKYLGLPLSVRRLRKIEFRPLVDKAAAKISGWYGWHLTQAGRACLTKSVLTSQPFYLLTVIKTAKDLLEDLDKMRKRFPLEANARSTGPEPASQK